MAVLRARPENCTMRSNLHYAKWQICIETSRPSAGRLPFGAVLIDESVRDNYPDDEFGSVAAFRGFDPLRAFSRRVIARLAAYGDNNTKPDGHSPILIESESEDFAQSQNEKRKKYRGRRRIPPRALSLSSHCCYHSLKRAKVAEGRAKGSGGVCRVTPVYWAGHDICDRPKSGSLARSSAAAHWQLTAPSLSPSAAGAVVSPQSSTFDGLVSCCAGLAVR